MDRELSSRTGRGSRQMIQRKLEVTYRPFDRTTRVPPGTTVFSAAHWIGLPIDSTCGGRGTCGKCKVRVLEGGTEATTADHRQLRKDETDNGWRLSCQARIYEDLTCEVPQLLRVPKAATMGLSRLVIIDPNVRKVYLELAEPDLEDQRSDVTRLRDALTAEGHDMAAGVAVLRTLPMTLRDAGFKVTAVLAGEQLVAIEPGDTTEECFGVAFDVGTTTLVGTLMNLRTGMAAAVRSTLNGQAPFGADVISRISHAMNGPDSVAELKTAGVATINGILDELYAEAGVTPARTYEAVEGSQIACGMRATDGAIEGVQLSDRVELQVIGGDVPAQGLCGSGLVDAVAQLLNVGLLDHSGRMLAAKDAPNHPLADRLIEVEGVRAFLLADGVYLSQRDVRELQFAKGSIATGIKVLMDILGVQASDLDEIFLRA